MLKWTRKLFGRQGKVKFIEKTVKKGIYTYETYEAATKADALAFLETVEVDKDFHYIVVLTPEGNWGKDRRGIYEEPCTAPGQRTTAQIVISADELEKQCGQNPPEAPNEGTDSSATPQNTPVADQTPTQYVESYINSHLDRIIAAGEEPSLRYAQAMRATGTFRDKVINAAVQVLSDVAMDRQRHEIEIGPATWLLGNAICMVSAFPCDSTRNIRCFYEASAERSYVNFLSMMTTVGSNVFQHRPFDFIHWLFALNERGGGGVSLIIFHYDPTQGSGGLQGIVKDNDLLG
jgi:hypothetical protein